MNDQALKFKLENYIPYKINWQYYVIKKFVDYILTTSVRESTRITDESLRFLRRVSMIITLGKAPQVIMSTPMEFRNKYRFTFLHGILDLTNIYEDGLCSCHVLY